MKNITIREAKTKGEFKAVFRLRKDVFVDEQKIFSESDRDEHDNQSICLIAEIGNEIIGTVRMYPEENNKWIGGRLAVQKKYRGSNAATLLVKEAVRLVKSKSASQFTSSIQLKNVGFFKRLGWESIGTVFNYQGIPHQLMAADFALNRQDKN